ncbi:unnamed protein product [Spirodela intermedia]|uniref:Uncharacterized protein n=1 Tax=Spirodela intermedia TaxID=51605 RepID=A0A7I8JJG7_SPIIN|nr:unnamed protein product [Spirodela intermedia]CAA6670317.1 unnamed protein product [Spirodela intermedia]
MGGGNGQKAKMAREKNMEKQKAARGSQLETNKKAMSIQCKVCMQTFICTTSEVKCREHAEASTRKTTLTSASPISRSRGCGAWRSWFLSSSPPFLFNCV